MAKSNVVEFAGRDKRVDPLTDLLRMGAEQLLYQAVEEELAEMLARHSERRLSDGRAGVVRNGYLPSRELQTGLGPVTVKVAKVRAKTGEAVTLRSALVPAYVRKTKTLEAALAWLYLKGISSGEMGAALEVLVGPQAKGCPIVSEHGVRLKQVWGQEYRSWSEERLDKDHWVSDGVYSGLRAEHTKLCALVVIGVNDAERSGFCRLKTEYGNRHRAGARFG